jgi:hypothetical protein
VDEKYFLGKPRRIWKSTGRIFAEHISSEKNQNCQPERGEGPLHLLWPDGDSSCIDSFAAEHNREYSEQKTNMKGDSLAAASS